MGREYPERPIVAVGGIVVRDGKVLLVQRGRAPGAGRWTIPGGAVRAGERLQEAVARELREECGVEVEVGPVVEVLDRVVRDEAGAVRFHYVIVDYLARWVAGEPRAGSDAVAARWLHREEWAALPLTEGLTPVLERALALVRAAH
ncbi:MAG TPA: NUDIX hydrolase [Candidatus Methylomirabilis sp.]|nr:NUDIX hydrolase [Candidatus Methylomirabilis sp.]